MKLSKYLPQTISKNRLYLFFAIKYNKEIIPLLRKCLLYTMGYRIISKYDSFRNIPAQKIKLFLDKILYKDLNLDRKFDNLLEFGCGKGFHYSNMLKSYTNNLIGVDIISPDEVKFIDDYIQVSPVIKESYFENIKSQSIDCIISISHQGMNISSKWKDWDSYIYGSLSRISRYFTQANFYRILRNNGLIILIEYDAIPEKRFGKGVNVDYVNRNIDKYYSTPQIDGFKVVSKGFIENLPCPYIVFQKE